MGEKVRPEETGHEEGSRAYKPSSRLRRYASTVVDEDATLADIVRALGGSTPGFVLLVLALPAFVPTGTPIAVPAGAAMIVIGARMMIGRTEITLPPWLAQRRLTRAQLGSIVQVTTPVMSWLERLLEPRLAWMLTHEQLRVIGLLVALDGLLILLPIPFGNTIPALAVLIISLGMMLGDGAAALIGLFVSIIALMTSIVLVGLGVEFIMLLFA